MSNRSKAWTAILAATAVLAAAPAAADNAGAPGDRLQTLLQGRELIVEPVFQDVLDGGLNLSLVRVEVAPNVTEPHHTHPGLEILYGLSGSGVVDIDGTAHPIASGTLIRVAAGNAKAISNPSQSVPLIALAVLVLDPDEPPQTVIEAAGAD